MADYSEDESHPAPTSCPVRHPKYHLMAAHNAGPKDGKAFDRGPLGGLWGHIKLFCCELTKITAYVQTSLVHAFKSAIVKVYVAAQGLHVHSRELRHASEFTSERP